MRALADELTSRGVAVRVSVSRGMAPPALYEASTILGATNVPGVLDVSRLAPGTLVVDDSAPHCFEVPAALARMRDRGDVALIEGGRVAVPGDVERRSNRPPALAPRVQEATWELLLGRGSNVMACLLSGALARADRSFFPPSLGASSAAACVSAARGFEALGVEAATPHLGDVADVLQMLGWREVRRPG
ncbi:MAG: hypothetical protein R3B82_20615 [Sandaracinaceae bacterium]